MLHTHRNTLSNASCSAISLELDISLLLSRSRTVEDTHTHTLSLIERKRKTPLRVTVHKRASFIHPQLPIIITTVHKDANTNTHFHKYDWSTAGYYYNPQQVGGRTPIKVASSGGRVVLITANWSKLSNLPTDRKEKRSGGGGQHERNKEE